MSEQPFAGVTVVEFGQFVAVPYCAQLLADGGAHVIKVEQLEGDPTRALAPLAPGETRHFLSRNRGKHSLPLDLRHPDAMAIIDGLLAKADIALFNLRPGLAEDMGLDYATLSARFPRLIVGSVTAFGRKGPDAGLPGMDLVVQARSGLMASLGKVRDGLPDAGETPITDYMCAVLLAFGLSSCLYRRERTGRGGEVDVTLLAAALVLQNNVMLRVEAVDGPGHASALDWLKHARAAGLPYAEQLGGLPKSRASHMAGIYYRTYATKDSAVVVACASGALQRRFMQAVEMTDDALDRKVPPEHLRHHYDVLQAAVEGHIATRSTAEWKAAFDRVGIPASAVYLPVELLEDEQALANGMVHDLQHPALGPIRILTTPLRVDADGFRASPVTPPFGSETRDILAGAGFSAAEIAAAIESGVTKVMAE